MAAVREKARGTTLGAERMLLEAAVPGWNEIGVVAIRRLPARTTICAVIAFLKGVLEPVR